MSGGLVLRGLRDLRAPAYPVTAGFRRDGRGPYPLDPRPMTRSFRPGADGVVAVPGPDGRPYRNPVSVSLYGLARHASGLRADFLTQAGYLRASQDGNGGWRYPVPVPRYRVGPGWYSAMAQGLATSVLLRGYDCTGERSYLDAASAAVALMLRPVSVGGCAEFDDAGRPFLEECPTDPPSHILNGALFAVIGLCEYEARADLCWLGPAGLRLASQLGRYDLGYWSRYDLRFAAPASLAYHCLHVSLLEVAAGLFPDDGFGHEASGGGPFGRVAARWRCYLRRPGFRLRAAANKARFVLGDGRPPPVRDGHG